MSGQSSCLDLSLLETKQDFRSDQLYFIRLVGTYIQSIFWDVLSADTKNGAKRRKKVFEFIAGNTFSKNDDFKTKFLDPRTRAQGTVDFFKSDFVKILQALEKFPLNQDETFSQFFEKKLKEHHAIFLKYQEFIAAIEQLLEKRHYLENYEERIKKNIPKNFSDAKVMEILGMFLLPELLGIFLGRVESCNKKMHSLPAIVEAKKDLTAIFEQAKQEKKRSVKVYYDDIKTREQMQKTKRKFLVSTTQKWLVVYSNYRLQSTDYNKHNFKTRYYFIGEQNRIHIEKKLQKPSRPLSFKHDVEYFYFLTAKINLVLHRFIERLPCNKDGKIILPDSVLQQKLQDIRNAIAHNQLFWNIPDYDEKCVIASVAQALATLPKDKKPREMLNDFFTALERDIEKASFSWVHYRSDATTSAPTDIIIQRWSADNRAAFGKNSKDREKLNKRTSLKPRLARWKRIVQQQRRENNFAAA
jgi:hypothetical protein